MLIIHIFTDFIAIPIFIIALLVSFYVYRGSDNKSQKLSSVSSFSFNICILLGVSYFMYGLSSDMGIENVGPYAAAMLLPILYSALFSLSVKIYLNKSVA
jgi:hypothetical protein